MPRARDGYPLEFHFPAAADWHEFLARPKAGSSEVDDRMLATAWDDPKGSVVSIDETSIATYERTGDESAHPSTKSPKPPKNANLRCSSK